MNEEYMKKAVRTIKVEFSLTQHHVDAVNELLEKFREYENNGKKPFADYTFDDVCSSIFMIGSYHTTDKHIKEAQFQMHMITADQLISDGMKTVAEWQEEERRQQARKAGSMKIKEIEVDKCGSCPLIEYCGDSYEMPHLCCDSRIEEMTVEEYKKQAEGATYAEIKRKADKMGLIIDSKKELSEGQQEEFDEENNCANNYKEALLEVICEKWQQAQEGGA